MHDGIPAVVQDEHRGDWHAGLSSCSDTATASVLSKSNAIQACGNQKCVAEASPTRTMPLTCTRCGVAATHHWQASDNITTAVAGRRHLPTAPPPTATASVRATISTRYHWYDKPVRVCTCTVSATSCRQQPGSDTPPRRRRTTRIEAARARRREVGRLRLHAQYPGCVPSDAQRHPAIACPTYHAIHFHALWLL